MSTELDIEVKDSSYAPADDFLPLVSSRSRRMWRTAIWGAAVVLIVGASVVVFYRRSHAAPVVHYETAAVERGAIAAKVTATGNLSSLLTVQVGSQVSGRVQYLYVD